MIREERRVLVRGVELFVSVARAPGRALGERPALVAVHGGPGIDGAGLRWFLDPLAAVADVVVPDQRGHGRSDRATAATWELDDWADDLAGLIDALGLRSPTVFGISFGGWVALRYAARHPGQAGSLVIAAQTARLPSVDGVAVRFRDLGGPAGAAAWLALHRTPADEQAQRDVRAHCLPLLALREPGTALAAVRGAQARSPEVEAHFQPQFATADLTPDARTVAVPFTLVLGERDPFTTVSLAAATVAAVAGPARLRVVPDAAHDLMVDAPQVLLEELQRALSGSPASAHLQD